MPNPQEKLLEAPKRKTDWLKLGIVILLFFFATFLIFYSQGWQGKNKENKEEKIGPSYHYELLGKEKGDVAGRTIFYKLKGGVKVYSEAPGYAGEGEVVVPQNKNEELPRYYLVGRFVGWDIHSGKEGTYIILSDPTVQVAVVFPYRIYFSGSRTTRFFVEDPSVILKEGVPSLQSLGRLSEWHWKDLVKLIKSGDTVIIVPYFVGEKGDVSLKDEKGFVVAEKLIIRRIGGKGQIEKELGKKL